ncbi:hypothetical protein HYU92_00995 [Candidatus Curtissbacteria bacterium]|nr:hypothetical protein [Candidatus Curtissbacteria bacterium]
MNDEQFSDFLPPNTSFHDSRMFPLSGLENGKVPKDIQIAFIDYVNSLESQIYWTGLKIVPENLFYVGQSFFYDQVCYARNYYKTPHNKDFDIDDLSSKLSIEYFDEYPVRFSIDKYGERLLTGRSPEHINVFLLSSSHFGIRVQYESNILDIYYQNLEFNSLNFKSSALKEKSLVSMFPDAKGSIIINNWDGSEVRVNDGQIITLERRVTNKHVDQLSFPKRIDLEDILGKLFSPQLLQDPFNASIEFDYWKELDLKHHFGIDWQRPN